jgi:hypothetical protein
MQRFATLATIVLIAAAGQVRAQDAVLDAPALEAAEEADDFGIGFMLRPAQDPDDEFWINQLATSLERPIGPPLAGPALAEPSGDEPIGPVLAGPFPPAPVLVRQPREEDADPFAATGLKLGSFIIRPAFEIGVAATDNVAGGRDEESAVGLIIVPEVSVRSEDERHEIEAFLRGEAILYGDEEFDQREADARLRARYDLTARTSLEATAAYSTDLDSYTDPDTPDAAVERPAVHRTAASLGVNRRTGIIGLGLAARVDRETHEEVALAGGGTASREELDNTEYGLRLTARYEASGAMIPFADVAAGRREYDIEVDSDGFERSSLWGELRGGLIFDMGSRLNGEVAVGYRREDLDDDDLDNINALIADAAILWSPQRLTELRLVFSTETLPTGIADSSGSILYSGGFTASRRVGARWRVEGGLGLDYERFVGADRRDFTTSAFAGLAYAFNRRASATVRYSYERTDSTDPEGDEDENVVSLRLRLQR